MNTGSGMCGDEQVSSSRFRVVKASAVPDPLVSVIVPVYNMESRGYLDGLILSLQSQTLDSIEFILVDDCSQDRSLCAAMELTCGDDRFAILASEKNGRQGAARNIGLDCARGHYIGFVDGDDVIDSTYFEELYYAAEREGAEITVAPFVKTDAQLRQISDPIVPITRENTGKITSEKLAVLIQKPAHIVSCLYSARLFGDLGIRFPEGVFFEDNPVCLRLLCSARAIAVLPQVEGAPRYHYRQHGSSTDHRTDNLAEQIKDRLFTSDLMLSDAKANGYLINNIDALELYYYRLALLNTLSKVSQIPQARSRRVAALGVRDHVRQNVRTFRMNSQFSQLPVREKLQISVALFAPISYTEVALLLAKKEDRKESNHDK